MKLLTLHYKDDVGIVRDTTRMVVADEDVERYLACYVTSDRVVPRVRDAKPGDVQRDYRRIHRMFRDVKVAA